MTTRKQVIWRRERIFDLTSRGLRQVQISEILKIPEYLVSKDVSYLRQQSQEKIKHFLDKELPFEYTKALHGLNSILSEMWTLADASEGRDKLSALAVAKDTYSMKLDLLSSVHSVERALEFVSLKRKEVENSKILDNTNTDNIIAPTIKTDEDGKVEGEDTNNEST
jgi:hypothetical protein